MPKVHARSARTIVSLVPCTMHVSLGTKQKLLVLDLVSLRNLVPSGTKLL